MSVTLVDDLHFPVSPRSAMLSVVVGKTFMFYAG